MKCSHCNSEVWPSDQFCGKCGRPVSAAVEPRAVVNKATEVAMGAIDEELEQAARALVGRGRKIEAVKLVRERTGCGLKDAKDYVESL